MSTVLYIIAVLNLLGIIPFFVVFIIQAIRKKKKAIYGFLALGCLTGVILFSIIGSAVDPTMHCDHSFELIEDTEATCTDQGIKRYHCDKCGKNKVEQIEALGHDMEEKSRTEATNSKDGEVVLECTRCGYTETKILPKLAEETKPAEKATEKQKATEAAKPKPTEAPPKPTQKPTEAPPTQAPTLSYEEKLEKYKDSCSKISYKELARNPEKHKGEQLKFRGEVIQVLDPSVGNVTTLRVNVTEEKIDYIDESIWTDTIYCTVTIPSGADRILENDIITFWGECKGLASYKSVLGQKISLPEINIITYEVE